MSPVVVHGRGIRRDEEAAPSEGPELITNGTFDSDISGWTNSSMGADWQYDSWNSGSAAVKAPGGA